MRADRGCIALIGLRGAGKSSVGRALAQLSGRTFVDLDTRLAELADARSPGELLCAVGEPRFRELESAALQEVLKGPTSLVLATGGGVVLDPGNRALLQAHCHSVWLEASPELLLGRIEADDQDRPALTQLDPLAELEQQLIERAPHYEQLAELRLDTSKLDVTSLARVILERTSN